jgi:hypothetical protein
MSEYMEVRGTGLRREPATFAQATALSRLVRVLLYAGALLVIGSFGWWAASLHVGPGGLLALSLLYAVGFLAAGLVARSKGLDELAAAAALIVAFYIPVVVYACLRLAGCGFSFDDQGVSAFYEWISGGWIWLELAAIAGTVVLYLVFRAPLLGLALTLFTLFLAEDATARSIGFDCYSDYSILGAVVLASGCALVAGATALDYAGLRRHAFWPHLLGAIGVVTGLEFLLADHSYQVGLIIAGAAFLLLGVWLGRVGYLALGGIAAWCGITTLAPSPLVLTISGLALVGTATWLSLARSPLRRWLHARTLPAPQRD